MSLEFITKLNLNYMDDNGNNECSDSMILIATPTKITIRIEILIKY